MNQESEGQGSCRSAGKGAQLAIQAKSLNPHRINQHSRVGGNVRNVLPGRGNYPEYLVARIARDHADIYERMQNGEFKSVAEAARAAGILKTPPRRVGLLPDVNRVAANIRKHYTPEQVRALKEAL